MTSTQTEDGGLGPPVKGVNLVFLWVISIVFCFLLLFCFALFLLVFVRLFFVSRLISACFRRILTSLYEVERWG